MYNVVHAYDWLILLEACVVFNSTMSFANYVNGKSSYMHIRDLHSKQCRRPKISLANTVVAWNTISAVLLSIVWLLVSTTCWIWTWFV